MLQVAHPLRVKAPRSVLADGTAETTSPAMTRQAIAKLVAQNRLSDAQRMTQDALQRYPHSEDILVISALVAQVQQDWVSASRSLGQLIKQQGHTAPAVTWIQWVRVLRCMGNVSGALAVAKEGLLHHPQDSLLLDEVNALHASGQ